MKKVLYCIVFTIWYLISLLPLKLLYVLSDGLFYLIYYVVKYRRPLVRKNLTDSFPEKSLDEIVKIERGFYSWFCDYIVETLKLFTMSKRQMRRRMVFHNAEAVDKEIAAGKSCAIYLGHYGNWEWISSLPLWLSDEATCLQIYHVLENKAFDELFLYVRGRMGSTSVPMADTLRSIIKRKAEGQRLVIGFIADQVPLWNSIHYWSDFLHHDTPVFTGTERIAKHQDMAVFYLDVSRPKRGYYEAEFKLVTDKAKEEPQFAITESYMKLLEATIQRKPQFWLWSHNRWKRTHEEYNRIMGNIRTKEQHL